MASCNVSQTLTYSEMLAKLADIQRRYPYKDPQPLTYSEMLAKLADIQRRYPCKDPQPLTYSEMLAKLADIQRRCSDIASSLRERELMATVVDETMADKTDEEASEAVSSQPQSGVVIYLIDEPVLEHGAKPSVDPFAREFDSTKATVEPESSEALVEFSLLSSASQIRPQFAFHYSKLVPQFLEFKRSSLAVIGNDGVNREKRPSAKPPYVTQGLEVADVSMIGQSGETDEGWLPLKLTAHNNELLVVTRGQERYAKEGKPRFADFQLMPHVWGAHFALWTTMMVAAYPTLGKFNLQRMNVTDLGLLEDEVDWISCFLERELSLELLTFDCLDGPINFEALERLVPRSSQLEKIIGGTVLSASLSANVLELFDSLQLDATESTSVSLLNIFPALYKLIYVYLKPGYEESARKMFKSLLGMDVVPWGTMMDGYICKGDWCSGLEDLDGKCSDTEMSFLLNFESCDEKNELMCDLGRQLYFTGFHEGPNFIFEVGNAQLYGGIFLHIGSVREIWKFSVDDDVVCKEDPTRAMEIGVIGKKDVEVYVEVVVLMHWGDLKTRYLGDISKVLGLLKLFATIGCLKKLFDKVEVYKSPASRDTSAEIFVWGVKYKAPAKIDPHLLDMKHFFVSSTEPKKVIEVLRGTKQKANGLNSGKGSRLAFKITNKLPYKIASEAQNSELLEAESVADKVEWLSKLGYVVEPSKRKPVDPEEELRWTAQEVRGYVEAVVNILAAKMPKAMVLCQVEKAERDMLNHLYSSISVQSTARIEDLLREGQNVVKQIREHIQKQSALLSKLTQQLSTHENDFAASEWSNRSESSPRENGQASDEWRSAFAAAANGSAYMKLDGIMSLPLKGMHSYDMAGSIDVNRESSLNLKAREELIRKMDDLAATMDHKMWGMNRWNAFEVFQFEAASLTVGFSFIVPIFQGYVCLNEFLIFASPRLPEIADLEDKVDLKDGGMLRDEVFRNLRELIVIECNLESIRLVCNGEK